ncbi:MAG: sugar phosphate nucleotidyltransferase [Patescibacteria group bacterium]|nr:sugar phosphate nucleotidyltransferase [Patescibacteria group bacterium]
MSRERLTITINKRLIGLLDDFIDGEKIRNRSHAIEYLLSKTLAPKVSRAIILAGGQGLKMRPFTYEMPKCLIPVRGKPLLEHTLDLLKKYEIRDIVITIGHLGEKVRNHFGDGSRFGVKITYADQGEGFRGTGGALKVARNLAGHPFLLFYGDVLANIDLNDLIDFHKSHGKTMTMALTSVEDSSVWGVVQLHGSQIRDFVEKPKQSQRLSRLINAGIYVVEPKIFDYFPGKNIFRLEEDVFPKLAQSDELYGYPFEGQWFDIGTPEIYARVIKEWNGIK